MMIILALDLGTQMGFALRQAAGIVSGSVSFAVNKRAGFGVRFLNFRNWLVEMLSGATTASKYHINMVVFEDVRKHAGVYAAHVYGGFAAQLAAICEERQTPYRGFGVKTIKKFITGNGNASKRDVINAVRNKGYDPIDDNEADAIALALLVENTLTKENKMMYMDNIMGSINNYSARSVLERDEVKICNAKSKAGRAEILTGPYKCSQVTGKSTPGSR